MCVDSLGNCSFPFLQLCTASLWLSATLLSCQLLYPWATSPGNLCTAMYNLGLCITASSLSNCCVMPGKFPSNVSVMGAFFCTVYNLYWSNFYELLVLIGLKDSYYLGLRAVSEWGMDFRKLNRALKITILLFYHIQLSRISNTLLDLSCSPFVPQSRLIASITSKSCCGLTALIFMCAGPMPSAPSAPT